MADAQGNWSYTPPSALDDGSYTIIVTTTDERGSTSMASVTFTIDTSDPNAPDPNQPIAPVDPNDPNMMPGDGDPNAQDSRFIVTGAGCTSAPRSPSPSPVPLLLLALGALIRRRPRW
jgi:uncharacterized protein (TIGR03382 family)